jgi:hypothetical protein
MGQANQCRNYNCCHLTLDPCEFPTPAALLQVGISDAWLQVSHLLSVFGGSELTPPVVAAMWKRLAGTLALLVLLHRCTLGAGGGCYKWML